MPSADEDDKKPNRIQSLMRASAILREISRNRTGIGLAQLSKAVGLHSSTTFHLVKTLVSLGYVRQDPETKAYRVGRLIFELARTAFDEIEIASVATSFLDELALRTGETSHLGIRSGDEIVVIVKSDGTGAFRMAERTGISRPAHATALGKVLLASMTPRTLELFLSQHELRQLTPRTLTDPERLAEEIAKVRRTGIAYDEGEFHPEIRCIAVPVRNFSGDVVAAVGISTPVWRLSLNDLQEKAEIVKAVAEDLSASFGHLPQTSTTADDRVLEPAATTRTVAEQRSRAANE